MKKTNSLENRKIFGIKNLFSLGIFLVLVLSLISVSSATREDNKAFSIFSIFTLFSSSGDTNCCYQCNPYASGTIKIGETKTIDYRSNSVYNRS